MKILLHTFLVFVGCCLHSLPIAAQVDAGVTVEQPEQHLFILSGQSNMTGGLVTGFSRKADHYGREESVMLGERFADRAIRMIKKPRESNKPSK